MIIFKYDGTFEGFLTVVFDSFEMKITPQKIQSADSSQQHMFAEEYEILTDVHKAGRVWKGLHKKLSKEACKVLSVTYMSELPDIEMLLYTYIRKAFESNISIENNFGDPCVLEVQKIFRKVIREADRVRMFVRFQKTKDDLFFASFDPLYNVIPLAIKHFEDRFADQKWIVFDTKRKYGFYYDLEQVSEIRFIDGKIDPVDGTLDNSLFSSDEKLFQTLWKSYFDNMTIKERINPKLHKQLLPKRFWKYLPEKQ